MIALLRFFVGGGRCVVIGAAKSFRVVRSRRGGTVMKGKYDGVMNLIQEITVCVSSPSVVDVT